MLAYVYMLGITLWQLFHGNEAPFAHFINAGELRAEFKLALELTREASIPLQHSDDLPQPLVQLIKRMCSISADMRPAIATVCDTLKLYVPDDFAKSISMREASGEYDTIDSLASTMKASIGICEAFEGCNKSKMLTSPSAIDVLSLVIYAPGTQGILRRELWVYTCPGKSELLCGFCAETESSRGYTDRSPRFRSIHRFFATFIAPTVVFACGTQTFTRFLHLQ